MNDTSRYAAGRTGMGMENLLMAFVEQQEVVAETREVIRKAGDGGGLILSSSNSIHSAVKPGDYLAMWNALRMYGKYPIELDNWTDSGAAEAFT